MYVILMNYNKIYVLVIYSKILNFAPSSNKYYHYKLTKLYVMKYVAKYVFVLKKIFILVKVNLGHII